jgi:hypothetical protein
LVSGGEEVDEEGAGKDGELVWEEGGGSFGGGVDAGAFD